MGSVVILSSRVALSSFCGTDQQLYLLERRNTQREHKQQESEGRAERFQ